MKNILVPTDFSDCANIAAEIAISIAKKNQAEIHFLHLFNSYVNWKEIRSEQEHFYPEIKKAFHIANSNLDNLVKKAQNEGLTAMRFMEFNESRGAIDSHIRDKKHDFVVVGSQGASKGSVMGSNAQKIVRNSTVPVLVVKEDNSIDDIKHILFTSNLELENLVSFEHAFNLSKTLAKPISALYVNTPGQFEESFEIENRFNTFKSESSCDDLNLDHLNALNVERGILQYCNRNPGCLIALTTHGRSGLLKFMFPSIAEGVVNHSTNPVFIYNIHS